MEGLDKKEEPNTREKTAEGLLNKSKVYAGNHFKDQEVITVEEALEIIRLSKIEALEESHNKISALSSLAHISDAQAILYNQITELKNG